ncbi:hypothetical protein FBY06_13164 [Pseudomonas sp. SJZ085]|nr:hypothetical protein FBX99_13064 [Pseudomonas sp. SJZ074]TWC31978.1 hypothetical protein FBY06_13164 [Pseudomonas sp. SJZ085]
MVTPGWLSSSWTLNFPRRFFIRGLSARATSSSASCLGKCRICALSNFVSIPVRGPACNLYAPSLPSRPSVNSLRCFMRMVNTLCLRAPVISAVSRIKRSTEDHSFSVFIVSRNTPNSRLDSGLRSSPSSRTKPNGTELTGGVRRVWLLLSASTTFTPLRVCTKIRTCLIVSTRFMSRGCQFSDTYR